MGFMESERRENRKETSKENNGGVEIKRVVSGLSRKLTRPHKSLEKTKMYPTIVDRNLHHIKAVESDESIARDLQNVSEIDGGIVNYVKRRMGCETVTPEVVRQAVAFEREMSRMSGW